MAKVHARGLDWFLALPCHDDSVLFHRELPVLGLLFRFFLAPVLLGIQRQKLPNHPRFCHPVRMSSRPVRSCSVWLGLLLGTLALIHPYRSHAQTIPWILPWDDGLPGVATDFSDLNRPVGTNWVRVDTNGHFVVNDERIRFLGVNFAGDSPFALTNYADGMAARVAKFGMNSVRFHHMDAPWGFNGGLLSYTSTTSTNFNATQLERLHYLIARLKAHGVYSDINLLVGRQYRANDGLGSEVAGMDSKDAHILGYFYPPALALQKDYANKLLGPTNRFTSLPLAQDPAVAFVEIINEQGIIQNWYEGALDRLPPRYATHLQARWNQWLAARYTNTARMLDAWGAVSQPLGTNLLVNGNFSNNLTGWNLEQHETAKASFIRTYDFTNGQPSLQVTVTNTSAQGWHIQVNRAGVRVASNQVYTVSFWAKAGAPTNVSASVMQAHDPWGNLGCNQAFALGTNWQLYTNTFAATATDGNARVGFSDLGSKRLTFWFADARLQAGGQLGVPPAGSSLEAGNLPNVARSGTGFQGTLDARRDWLRFLRDLESLYYAEMVAHLRTNLRYPGLIFGTIMANSPATVQSTMDVIDSHAYWKHPVFPGVAWDSSNWYVENVSMTATMEGNNTLSSIGRQRVKGKPFVCTEYQHPSPNYYGAEGPLLLAAYAGLQDWDGLWLFDYGHGNPSGGLGYVSSYFQTAQHPTKMANTLLAANLFRRQDVRPARNEFTLALTPEREIDLLLNAGAWSLFSGGQLGMPGKMVFTSRVSTAVGAGASGLPAPPAGPAGGLVVSDTGELRWDTQGTNGLVTYNTPRSKGLVGFADNQTLNFDGLQLRPGTTMLGWCSLGLTLRRGEVFTNDCSALIVATGWWENTGQVWKDPAKTSVKSPWGRSPVLTEVVPFTLTLAVATNHVRVWALNPQGQRAALMPLGGNSQQTIFTAPTNSGAIWYELEISRWTASYDLWRNRYFSLAEQGRPGFSGPAAHPYGGSYANLVKYLHGLRPQDHPATNLSRSYVLSQNSQKFLAMTFDRDRLATDVLCMPEVSPDLLQWFSGPPYAKVESVASLGGMERVTVRDLSPIGPESRYLRVRYTLQ